MLTSDQVAILLLAWVFAAGLVCAFVAAGAGATMPRHAADRTGPAGPPTGPILLGQGAGVPDTIRMPRPRPYTDGIPVLVVEGPPGARGTLPADGLPVEIKPSCSFCRDGLIVMARSECPWCGRVRA